MPTAAVATHQRKQLGQLLVGRGVLSAEHLDRALDEQRRQNFQKLLGEVLVDLQLCDEQHVSEALAESYEVPFARVTPRLADPRAVAVLPKEFLDKHAIVPLFVVEGTLTVATSEPANLFLIEELERLTGHTVQVVAATLADIRATLRAFVPGQNAFVVNDVADELQLGEVKLLETRAAVSATEAAPSADAPVVKLVNYCIYHAVKQGAAEVHVEPAENLLRVRYRIDGRLVERLRPPSSIGAAIATRVKRMADLDPAERRLPQDGTIRLLVDDKPVELRASTMPGRFGEKVVLRIVEADRGNLRLERLGFDYDALKQWRKLLTARSGVLLVVGPAGSGKTSTLYASLREVNAADANVCTIESPIESTLTGVNQFQVNEPAGFSYPVALRSLLAQGPDAVMIQDLHDPEAARLATQAALTGHLILTSLHAPDAPAAVARLQHLGVEPYLVASSLSGVCAQRLVRKLCQSCKESYVTTQTERRQLEKQGVSAESLFRPKGCPRCRNTGFSGRIGVFEVLPIDDTFADLISHGAPAGDLRQLAAAGGVATCRADGVEKAKAGITTLEEVFHATA